ncbi:uncharacterized protein V6R79_005422 [Siganus canaliculatus]
MCGCSGRFSEFLCHARHACSFLRLDGDHAALQAAGRIPESWTPCGKDMAITASNPPSAGTGHISVGLWVLVNIIGRCGGTVVRSNRGMTYCSGNGFVVTLPLTFRHFDTEIEVTFCSFTGIFEYCDYAVNNLWLSSAVARVESVSLDGRMMSSTSKLCLSGNMLMLWHESAALER